MKKLLLILGLSLLLTACEESTPVVDSTPGDPAVENVFAPQPFYIISITTDGRMAGENEINTDPVEWLSESDGTCRNGLEVSDEGASIPQCNPNGFLIVNETSDDTAGYMIPENTPVYVRNLSALIGMEYTDSEEGALITFEQLTKAFEENPEFFETTPFILEFGTVTVTLEGQEILNQVSSIKEIYIP